MFWIYWADCILRILILFTKDLKHNRIWAAALDVWENEPAAPTALVAFDQAVITPHIAGISPEAINANVGRVVDNLRLHRAGKPPISPI